MSKSNNPTYHISLTPTLANFLENLVSSGLYANASEVIREALRDKYQNKEDQKLEKLKQEIKIGLDQMERGETVEVSLEDMLKRVQKRN